LEELSVNCLRYDEHMYTKRNSHWVIIHVWLDAALSLFDIPLTRFPQCHPQYVISQGTFLVMSWGTCTSPSGNLWAVQHPSRNLAEKLQRIYHSCTWLAVSQCKVRGKTVTVFCQKTANTNACYVHIPP
jgi:hypothetical protein